MRKTGRKIAALISRIRSVISFKNIFCCAKLNYNEYIRCMQSKYIYLKRIKKEKKS